ncbi:hypothetical protein HU735_10380 [Pseudomonas sp. BW16M2]|uniref:hypothetical protein n=1 Tax=Pseudomonas sp. BW16M2 TaxID=2745489 RepID=UPI001647D361|nr:hypothetical protein [Pseudomonas sp. BW16M2]MBC3435819.1 hypothetical protein [Pseudomonas sp. BW16M2]
MGKVIGKVVCWFLVIIAGFLSIAWFSTSVIAGLLGIVATAFFCPLIWKVIPRTSEPRVHVGACLLIAFVAFFVGTGVAVVKGGDIRQATQQGFVSVEEHQAASALGLDAAGYTRHKDEIAAAEKQKVEQAEATKAKVASACRHDLQCWAEKNQFDAIMACQPAIQQLAKFDYEWTDGMTTPIFSKLAWGDQKRGEIIYLGDEVKFQNGFGNFLRHKYACTFDPASKLAVNASAEPGRL